MKKFSVTRALFLTVALSLLAGCGGGDSSDPNPGPLSAENVNLIFVVSPDLAYHTPGDIDPGTANLSNQGLQRSLLMATYLKTQVLGMGTVTSISALQPMTHLQTANNYPDMAAIGFIQQFSFLNQITLPVDNNGGTYTANTHPINVAYAAGSVPSGVFIPEEYCPDCQGLDFNNAGGNNDKLLSSIINKKTRGNYVFSAPWETISALLAYINSQNAYKLDLPKGYMGSNYVYAISIPPSGDVGLITYNSNLNPPPTYPVLPSPVELSSCTYALQANFSTTRTGGVDGVVIPANINKNQKIYIIRHAESHPGNWLDGVSTNFESGNIVGAGQWRALELPNALRGKMSPTVVYSVDPAQWFPILKGELNIPYVQPALTVEPYAIANNLPYYLVSSFSIMDPDVAKLSSNFFFTDGKFSNQTVLLSWRGTRIKPMINELLKSYGGLPLVPGDWPIEDYDTIWTVTLDAQGNLAVDNNLCEGIDSTKLPATAPQF